jgi:hypothetical protein
MPFESTALYAFLLLKNEVCKYSNIILIISIMKIYIRLIIDFSDLIKKPFLTPN